MSRWSSEEDRRRLQLEERGLPPQSQDYWSPGFSFVAATATIRAVDCPRGDGQLGTFKVGRIELDRCGKCRGVWYDRDEFRHLKDREAHGDYRWLDFDLWKQPSQFGKGSHRNYHCPRDGSGLGSVAYAGTAIQVDVCRECKGLWLDKDEYDAILHYLEHRVDAETVTEYRRDLNEQIAQILRGPEGPISELRDALTVMHLLQLRLVIEHPKLEAALENLPPV